MQQALVNHPQPMSATVKLKAWKQCTVCTKVITFKSPGDFSNHLRECHCIREGGSFVCKYGYNGVCSSLPVEGVSDRDYEDHVARHHIFQAGDIHTTGKTVSKSGFMVPSLYPGDHPNVVADPPEWTVYSSTLNLPAILNDPNRGKEKDFFTKTWGDTFVERVSVPPCPYLPEVTKGHFEDFLKKVSQVQRVRRHGRRPRRTSQDGEGSSTHPKLPNLRTLDWSQADLEHIPKIFLQPNFTLNSPETFNAVFPCVQPQTSGVAMLGTTPASQHSVRLVQEKLSHYLDTVEVQIAKHVSLRSNAFFHAMTSHDTLMEQLTATIKQVTNLRNRVHHIDAILVKGSLRILKLKYSRHAYFSVYKKLKLIATVHQTQPTIQILLSQSDFVGALDLISATQEVLEQELMGIHSFRHLGSQLAELEKVIEKMMHTDFIRYAAEDLSRPLVDSEPLMMEEERLVAIILGMLRLRKHAFLNAYHEETFDAIKTLVKKTVVEVISQITPADMDTNSVRLAEQVRRLDFSAWMILVTNVLKNLSMLLQRVQAVQGVMCDTIDVAAGKAHCPATPDLKACETPEVTTMQVTVENDEVTVTEEDHVKLSNMLKEMLTASCDYADDRSAKIFAAKSKTKRNSEQLNTDGFFEKLSVSQFIVLSKVVDDFVAECESICGKKSTNLHLALQSQAHRFVGHFHDEKKNKLGLILDSEYWKQANVPTKFQKLVDHIFQSDSMSIPKQDDQNDLIEDKKGQEFLIVKGEQFAVIGTVLLLLNMVVEYCDCVNGLPCVASDLLAKLVELLKTFNSRTCQLVLGAGALQLVGLKTITTKNLALASRCLQLMASFIPRIKMHFNRHLPARQQNVCKQFDYALKDYNDHIQEISNKLVSIMANMSEVQLSKWEVKPPVPSPCFRAICRQLTKLHEAIADILPLDQVQKLFFRINAAFKANLKRHLQKMNVLNDGGPQHGLVTSELAFYLQSLKSINCIRSEEDLGMNDIWVLR